MGSSRSTRPGPKRPISSPAGIFQAQDQYPGPTDTEGRRTAPTPAVLLSRSPHALLSAAGKFKKGKNNDGDHRCEVLHQGCPRFSEERGQFQGHQPLLADPKAFAATIDAMTEPFLNKGIGIAAGIESRGFLLATPIAYHLKAGVVPLRKKGKLPRQTRSADL